MPRSRFAPVSSVPERVIALESLGSDHVSIDGASHWGMVLNRRLLTGIALAVTSWLDKAIARGA